jgi:lysophospholipase L1-like esterase
VRAPLLLGAALLVLAGCTQAPASDDSVVRSGSATPSPSTRVSREPGPLDGARYVALGDSFTSGPLIPTTDLAGGCFRSDHNYPALLATRIDAESLVDVSCAGARTRDLTHRQRTVPGVRVPPQLAALDEDTTLVTVGIGGNDFDLYSRLTHTCLRLRDSDPTGAPCRAALTAGDAALLDRIGDIGRHVQRALQQVRQRAPEARVFLVGYPHITPAHGTCPDDLLPYATGDVQFADEVLRGLNSAMDRAADRSGVEFLDVYRRSEGHDICSDAPYVNGAVTDRQRAAAFHPFARGMRAVARGLERLLSRG